MKKIVNTLSVIFFLTTGLYAQNARFGFNGGILSAVSKVTSDNETSSSKSKIGFTVGVMADVPIGSNFSFQPGLSFLQKGGQDTQNDGTNTTKVTISVNCLELPLNLVYKTGGKAGGFFIGAGPSLTYNLSGKIKATVDGTTISQSIKFGSGSEDMLKRFELGGNFLTGYEFSNGLSLTLNYNIGFNNISADPQSKWKSSYVGLRLGYFLKGNIK